MQMNICHHCYVEIGHRFLFLIMLTVSWIGFILFIVGMNCVHKVVMRAILYMCMCDHQFCVEIDLLSDDWFAVKVFQAGSKFQYYEFDCSLFRYHFLTIYVEKTGMII